MHFHSRLTWFTFFITLIALGSATLVWNHTLQRDRWGELDERLLDQARVLAAMLPDGSPRDHTGIKRVVRVIHGETRSRLTIITADGIVLAETDLPEDQVPGMENHLHRPEVQEALARGVGRDVRVSPTLGIPMAYLAVRWGPAMEPYGVARASLPMTHVLEEQRRGRGRLVLVLLGSLVLSGLLGNLAARRFSRPVTEVSRTAREIAGGNLRKRVEIRGSVEAKELAAAVNDLAESVLAQITVVEAERKRLAQLLEGMPDGIVALDPEGRISLANEAAQEILGLGEEFTGLRPVEAVRSAELQQAVDLALERSQAGVVEITLLDPERRTLAVNLVPLESGLVIVLHDVTRLRRLEAARREMVANIGHELRTPLSAISGYLETLEHSSALSAEDRSRFLGVIARNSRRLERLVQDLSHLARLESAQVEFHPESLELTGIVQSAVETLGPRADSKAVELRSDVAPGLPPVLADRDGLETVLLNLLDNAIRVTPEGRTVLVAVAREGDEIRVSVSDRGPGIPVELRDRVFERFYRMDMGRTTELGGSGLGLAIVKHAVLLHGGEICIEDHEGGGATFRFTLPLAPEGGEATPE